MQNKRSIGQPLLGAITPWFAAFDADSTPHAKTGRFLKCTKTNGRTRIVKKRMLLQGCCSMLER